MRIKKGERAFYLAPLYNMSVFDIMECKNNQEKQEIRIAVNAWKQAAHPERIEIIENKIDEKKEKIRSLLFLVNVINKGYPDEFISLVEYDKTGFVDEYVHDQMMTSGGRYMISAEMAIYNATTEAVTQMILQDEKAQDFLDEILSDICPRFYSKKNSETKTINLITEFLSKKASSAKNRRTSNSLKCFSLEKDTLAFLYYIIIWKIEKDEDNERAMVLHRFIKNVEIEPGNIINERRTDTSVDWLAELLNVSPEKITEDKLFLKYQESCFRKAALWLYEVLEEDKFLQIDKPEVDYCMEQQQYKKFLFIAFDELLLKLQNINDTEEVEAKTFGRNPLSVILNYLSEIKWYPKSIGEKNINTAFNLAVLSTTASYAILSFDGEDLDKLERTNLIRKSSIDNPEQFVCNLFTSFVLNLISVEYKHKDFETYSVGHDMEKMLEKAQTKKQQDVVQEQDNTLELKELEIERLKKTMWALSEKQQDENKKLDKKIKPLENENRILQKENEKLKEELESLKQKKAELESMIEAYEEAIGKQEEASTINETCTDEELWQQKILFVGGRYELVRTLKNIMENAKFVQTETDPIPDFNKIDRIIYFSNFINHSTYNKVFDRAKGFNIPYQFVHTQNFEQVWGILKKNSF